MFRWKTARKSRIVRTTKWNWNKTV